MQANWSTSKISTLFFVLFSLLFHFLSSSSSSSIRAAAVCISSSSSSSFSSSSSTLSLSSSSCLIYSRMQMMPSRDDYHHYHSLAFSLESTHWQEKRDELKKINGEKPFFAISLLFSFVDYLTITSSIAINVSSAHQLKLDEKAKEKETLKEERKKRAFSGI